MRFKIIFKVNGNPVFPFNYQYELSAGLYKIFLDIKNYSKEYAKIEDVDFLNQITFSRIEIPKRKISKDGIKCFSNFVFLKVSTGLPDIGSDDLWRAFKNNLNKLVIFKKMEGFKSKIELCLEDIEFTPPPNFQNTMKFKMLSPLVLTKKNNIDKKKFLSHHEQKQIEERIKDSLIEKFNTLYNKEIDINQFQFQFDPIYCQDKNEKDLYCLTKMKEGTENAFSVFGMMIPFSITAPLELIKVGYYSGFGEKSSLGFGMVESTKRIIKHKSIIN